MSALVGQDPSGDVSDPGRVCEIGSDRENPPTVGPDVAYNLIQGSLASGDDRNVHLSVA